MKNYLKNTAILNYKEQKIIDLINASKWKDLDEFDKIGAIYNYVQNKILLGYNK